MALTLPPVIKTRYFGANNRISRFFADATTINDYVFLREDDKWYLSAGDIRIYLTNKDQIAWSDDVDRLVKINRAFSRKDFREGHITFQYWIKHPRIVSENPDDIVVSWRNTFHFIEENKSKNISGLRPPQLGGLYSALGHLTTAKKRGIIVMPTGTGKTETMLSLMVAYPCNKVLVIVPSVLLREQITDKFVKLGLLKKLGLIDDSAKNPYVATLRKKLGSLEEAQQVVTSSNVLVATMQMIASLNEDIRTFFSESFSHLFVDEAHHSQASTWKSFINLFEDSKVLLFTATPYRNDGQKLEGKFVFNFSLKDAQTQGYYKPIKFIPVREYNQKIADQKIADLAVKQLREDMAKGLDHLLLARCATTNRAEEVYQIYEAHEDLNPVLIYNKVKGIKNKIADINAKKHRIIVCVNMFGEGFDLPELKIGAIHDHKQSLPITLQFIGRFTRTDRDATLGFASFITNRAYPPDNNELDQLFSRDPDWNLILPNVSEKRTNREIDFQKFLSAFHNVSESTIPFQSIRFSISALLYEYAGNTWNPSEWEKGISKINSFEHKFSSASADSLVILLGKSTGVQWGTFDTVQELTWNIIVIHWAKTPKMNLIFAFSSFGSFDPRKLLTTIFTDSVRPLKDERVFRVFHKMNQLRLFNVGAKKGLGKNISFQSYYGRQVEDGLDEIEKGTIQKNNIFGLGYRDGEKVTLGCSIKGRVWSFARGNLLEWQTWCRQMGALVSNETINPNIVLKGTIIPETLTAFPNSTPIAIDWHEDVYKVDDSKYEFAIGNKVYDFSSLELGIASIDNGALIFYLNYEDSGRINFEYIIDEVGFRIRKLSPPSVTVNSVSIESFLTDSSPRIWFHDNTQVYGNKLIPVKEDIGALATENLIALDWSNVNLSKESMGPRPYREDSIQFYFYTHIKEDFEVIIDDDGSGETADLVGINELDDLVEVSLFHLKFALGGKTSRQIKNFYEVCGQAQKSLNWKFVESKLFFNKLFRRNHARIRSGKSSRIIKGSENRLSAMADAAKKDKRLVFKISVVQPGLKKKEAGQDILRLLGNTRHYLKTVGNIEFSVYCS